MNEEDNCTPSDDEKGLVESCEGDQREQVSEAAVVYDFLQQIKELEEIHQVSFPAVNCCLQSHRVEAVADVHSCLIERVRETKVLFYS